MSTVLPELARQLDRAAERHYRRRRAPRILTWAIPALAVAAVAVALVLAPSPPDDERPASRTGGARHSPEGAFGVFGRPGPPLDPALQRNLALELNFAKRPPVKVRVAAQDGSRQVVLVAGRNKEVGDAVVCVYLVDADGAAAVCKGQAKLLTSARPWVLPIGTGPVILVRDDVTRITLRLADGTTRELTPHNNVAIGRGDNACSIEWQLVDGSRHATPVDGSPPERCG